MISRRAFTVTLLLAFSALGGTASHGQTVELSEPAQRWLDAFNSGDFAAMEKLQAGAADSEGLLRQYEVYLTTRGIDPVSVNVRGANEVVITGTERLSGDRANVVLDTSGAVARLKGVRMVREPEAKAGSNLSEADVITELDKQVTRRAEADEFSGAILIAKDGKTLFKKAWGVANKATGASAQIDTKFNLASAGKMFTAVATLQLAQTGKLSLDDTVGKYLPDYKNEDVRNKVTIRQLLSHTSGLGNIFDAPDFEKRRLELRKAADFVSLFETEPLLFEPGTRWGYSNAGFCLLGYLVEKVSGQDYYEYLNEHIFQPAGMKNTGAFEIDRPNDNLAIGYTRMGATTPEQMRDRLENTDMHTVKGSPAGGNYSTAEDMANFAAALLGQKLLNEEYTRLALTKQPQTDAYGLGFGVETLNGHTIVGHSGGFPGINTSIDMFPDDGYVVIVLSNYDMAARRFAFQMRDWITTNPDRKEP